MDLYGGFDDETWNWRALAGYAHVHIACTPWYSGMRYVSIISQSSSGKESLLQVQCNQMVHAKPKRRRRRRRSGGSVGAEQAKVALKWSVRCRHKRRYWMRMATFRCMECVQAVCYAGGLFRMLDGCTCILFSLFWFLLLHFIRVRTTNADTLVIECGRMVN